MFSLSACVCGNMRACVCMTYVHAQAEAFSDMLAVGF